MKIAVLMSTYNGEKYIRQQIDSILHQTVVQQHVAEVQLVIRDDGSKDETISILENYIADGSPVDIVLEKEPNMGVIASFFELIKNAPEADYYAFSDQDDYWFPEKLEVAVKKLQDQSPMLYCGDTFLADSDLNPIKPDVKNPRPSFGNALVENVCTGCTAVINRALMAKIKKVIPNTSKIVMHDWWLYLMAETYGTTIYDSEPHMYYRQHGNNEWGAKTSKWAVLQYRMKRLFADHGQIYRQLEELERFLANDQEIDKEKKCQIKKVLNSEKSFAGKCKLIADKSIYRNSKDRDRVYRFAVLVGKL